MNKHIINPKPMPKYPPEEIRIPIRILFQGEVLGVIVVNEKALRRLTSILHDDDFALAPAFYTDAKGHIVTLKELSFVLKVK